MTSQGNSLSGKLAVVALSALLSLSALGLPAAAGAAGSISGTVTDAATDARIEGVQVCAWPAPEDGEVSHCGTTDSNGEYTIVNLLTHGYNVAFDGDPLDYQRQWYDHTDEWWLRTTLMVGSEPITGIDAALHAYGRIEGVVDGSGGGGPLEDVRACAWEIGSDGLADCAWTDAVGTYAIEGVPPGEYVLGFTPTGNWLWQAFDQKESLGEADPVSVELGEVVTEINASLDPGARVKGTVRRADNQGPLPATRICAWGISEESLYCAYSDEGGSYEIRALPTDEYAIEFWHSNQWKTQFWDHKASLDEADPLPAVAGVTATGIDADLFEANGERDPLPPSPLAEQPLLFAPPSVQVAPPRLLPRHCRKGFHKKRVKGKVRCVRKQKRNHQRPPKR